MTSSSTLSLKVFSEESLRILRVRGNDMTVRSGFHTVLNTSYASESSVDSQATVDIPEDLESIETLQFLEFVPSAASVIWNSLLQRRQNDPQRANILDEAKKHISAFEDAVYADDDWFGTMEAMGLTKSCQARLMDPDFEYMRLSATLKETVYDMLEMRYEFLSGLDDVVKGPAINSFARNSSRLNADDTFTTVPAPDTPFQGS